MEANGRLGKEAQKLLIALSCAIVRMENKHPEGTDAFRFAAGKEKKKKNLRLKTKNKSTGEAQSANYLKSRTDYTTQCQLVNAKLENDELMNPA
jgi:hypothetical protein